MKIRITLFALVISALVLLPACQSLDKLINGKEPVIDRFLLSRYVVDPGDTLTITVLLQEGTEPLTYSWQAEEGQYIQPTDAATVTWQAPARGGTVKLTAKVSNDMGSDKHAQDVTVRSYVNPMVALRAPRDGIYFTQFQQINVEASASHENGIEALHLFVNDTLRSTLAGQTSSGYVFEQVLLGQSGLCKLKVEAEARTTGVVGKDSVTVHVEGIVIGKRSLSHQ
jgi:hypothetical protein